jgi:diketogulonate reductase-like aldo/keto reductase
MTSEKNPQYLTAEEAFKIASEANPLSVEFHATMRDIERASKDGFFVIRRYGISNLTDIDLKQIDALGYKVTKNDAYVEIQWSTL